MKSGLALFDFDGTITRKDSALTFYQSIYTNRFDYLFRHIFLCLPEFILYRLGWTDYVPLKRKRLQIHVGRLTYSDYSRFLVNFHMVLLPSIIKQSALDRIDWHKSKGHEIWIVSASYDFLLSDWCNQLGLNVLYNITKKNQGNCIFEGEDCNFNGKVNQIKKNIKLSDYEKIYAYGDSEGDYAMISLAHESNLNFFI
jgi:HAD superfamily hydrolase (TIGR01490 family)